VNWGSGCPSSAEASAGMLIGVPRYLQSLCFRGLWGQVDFVWAPPQKEQSTAGGAASQVIEIVVDRLPALVEDGSSSPVCVLGGRVWFDGVGAGGGGGGGGGGAWLLSRI